MSLAEFRAWQRSMHEYDDSWASLQAQLEELCVDKSGGVGFEEFKSVFKQPDNQLWRNGRVQYFVMGPQSACSHGAELNVDTSLNRYPYFQALEAGADEYVVNEQCATGRLNRWNLVRTIQG